MTSPPCLDCECKQLVAIGKARVCECGHFHICQNFEPNQENICKYCNYEEKIHENAQVCWYFDPNVKHLDPAGNKREECLAIGCKCTQYYHSGISSNECAICGHMPSTHHLAEPFEKIPMHYRKWAKLYYPGFLQKRRNKISNFLSKIWVTLSPHITPVCEFLSRHSQALYAIAGVLAICLPNFVKDLLIVCYSAWVVNAAELQDLTEKMAGNPHDSLSPKLKKFANLQMLMVELDEVQFKSEEEQTSRELITMSGSYVVNPAHKLPAFTVLNTLKNSHKEKHFDFVNTLLAICPEEAGEIIETLARCVVGLATPILIPECKLFSTHFLTAVLFDLYLFKPTALGNCKTEIPQFYIQMARRCLLFSLSLCSPGSWPLLLSLFGAHHMVNFLHTHSLIPDTSLLNRVVLFLLFFLTKTLIF